ncbi:hypothetical protein PS6_000318 [Mucor atramentarius]
MISPVIPTSGLWEKSLKPVELDADFTDIILGQEYKYSREYLLNQHAFRHHMFDPSLLMANSEQSYVVKFWGYLFEEYFGARRDIYLQW